MELSQHQTWTELATRSHNNNGEGGIRVLIHRKAIAGISLRIECR